MVKPIKPGDLDKRRARGDHIPDKVVAIVNHLITEKWDGRSATILQDDLVDRIVSGLDVSRETVFEKHWLDVEPVFEGAGWRVEYDKPGFNESYPASFKFTKKRTLR